MNQVQYIGLQPLRKTPISYFQAPTWSFVRLQPVGLRPYLVKAPTFNLGAPTLRTQILLILRHQLQGLRPYLVKAPTMDLGAPTPWTPILPILRHQPQGL